jgi:aryl sulfotransferase
VTRGWFEWEPEGWPYWSSAHHAQTWFDYRHLPNTLFVHYGDMLADPTTEIARIARFIGLEPSAEELARVVEATAFETMKQKATDVVGAAAGMWEGGAQRFINKGTNGRWREELSQAELAQYDALIERALSPGCAQWLEQGRSALTGAANP